MPRILEFEAPNGDILQFEEPETATPSTPVDQTITNRPSRIRATQQLYQQHPAYTVQHPLGFLLNQLGAGYEAAEAIPANLALKLQQGQSPGIADILAGLSGERPAKFTDVFQAGRIPHGGGPLEALSRVLANPAVSNTASLAMVPGGAQAEVSLAKLTPALIRGSISGVKMLSQGGAKLLNFLKGNPQGIESAEQGLNQAAHEAVSQLRRGGTQNQRVLQTMYERGQAAWQPMKELGRAIQQPTTIEELKGLASNRYADDPQFLQIIHETLDDIGKSYQKNAFTGDELVDTFTNLGQSIRRTTHQGKAVLNASDHVVTQLRSLIGEALEAKAPEELQGAFAQANADYATHATDRGQLYQFFSPRAPKELIQERGEKLLKRAAMGEASPAETGFLDRLHDILGFDLRKALEDPAQTLEKAKIIGQRGKVASTIAKIAATGAIGGTSAKVAWDMIHQ